MLPVVPTRIFINNLCWYCSLCPSFIDRVTWTRATIFERICFAVWRTHFKIYLLFTCPRSLPAVDTILFTTLYVHHVIWFLKTYLVLILVHRQGIAEVSTFCLSRTYLYSQELRCTSPLQHEILYHTGYLCRIL